jgi:hypothetical protein
MYQDIFWATFGVVFTTLHFLHNLRKPEIS